jgi:hypothetical protein
VDLRLVKPAKYLIGGNERKTTSNKLTALLVQGSGDQVKMLEFARILDNIVDTHR